MLLVAGSLRTRDSEIAYALAKKSGLLIPLDQEPRVHQWQYWYLIRNRFPYDAVFETHDMLLPVSGGAHRSDLTSDEKEELELIKNYFIEPGYHLFFENTRSRRSVASIYHLHLAKYYPRRESFKL